VWPSSPSHRPLAPRARARFRRSFWSFWSFCMRGRGTHSYIIGRSSWALRSCASAAAAGLRRPGAAAGHLCVRVRRSDDDDAGPQLLFVRPDHLGVGHLPGEIHPRCRLARRPGEDWGESEIARRASRRSLFLLRECALSRCCACHCVCVAFGFSRPHTLSIRVGVVHGSR
jgi:hypothetical protein